MPTEPKSLDDLFLDTLKNTYYAEKQIEKAQPKMAKAATAPEVKTAFEPHRDETEGHAERLAEVFELIGKAPRGKTCDAILGIIEEGKSIMEEFEGSPALDAGLRDGAVRHPESRVQQLGLKHADALLDQALAEETKTDKLLSQIGTASADSKAQAKSAA